MPPEGGVTIAKVVRRRTVLVRLTYDGQELYEGEIEPGHFVDIGDLKLEVLWIRRHEVPADLP